MRRLVQVCALSSVVAISGCTGSSGAPASSSPTPIVESPSPSFSLSPSPTATETEAAGPTGTPTVPPSPTDSASVAAECTTATLSVSAGAGGAAAGTDYIPLVFTNHGDASCWLRGYPGASFVDSTGQQLGLPADRSQGEPRPRVVLAAGEKAHALLGVPATENYSQSDCQPRHAAGIRIYPPDQTQPLVARIKLTVCTTKDGRSLIEPVRPGTRG